MSGFESLIYAKIVILINVVVVFCFCFFFPWGGVGGGGGGSLVQVDYHHVLQPYYKNM